MIKLFTHTDLDGIGCAILLMKAVEKEYLEEIEYCDYDNIEQRIQKFIDESEDIGEHQIFVTDISVSEKFAEKIDAMKNLKIVLIDHHKTALDLNRFSWCHVDTHRYNIPVSGTELFHEYLKMKDYPYMNNKELIYMTRCIGDWDTWRWKSNGNSNAKDINDLFYLIDRAEFIEWCFECFNHNSYFPCFTVEHYTLIKHNKREIEKYIDSCNRVMFRANFDDKICGVVFADRYISETGNRLCELNPEVDFVALINPSTGTVSYRTIKDDIDLGKDVAAKFGGGGHPKAAGSQFSSEIFQDCVKKMFGGR